MGRRLLAFSILLLSVACGGEKDPAGPSDTTQPVVASIAVSPTQQTLSAIGTTQQFTAVAKDASDVTISGKTFSWSSSEPSVATVDPASGLATAVENGTTAITATTDGVSGSTALEVEQAATKIVFVTQPTDAVSGEPIAPAVVAEVRDANDNLAELSAAPVTLTIETNPRGGTLSGIATVNAVGGVATFDGLSIDKPATDYTLAVASGTLSSVTSEPFSITQRTCSLVPIPIPLPGTFSTGPASGAYYTVDEPRVAELPGVQFLGFVIADFNNDGLDDVITSGPGAPNVGVPLRILANDGGGSFVDATTTIISGEVPAPIHAREGLAADFNGDGWIDVFIASHGFDTGAGIGELNTLLLSDGLGGLVDSPANIHDVRGFSHSAAAGDVDCDGDIDIYVGNMGHPGSGEPNYLMINDGTGNFTVHKDYLPEFVLFVNDGQHPDWRSSSIADLDGDNFPELILGRASPPPGDFFSESVVLWNDGTGNFDFVDFTALPDSPGNCCVADILPLDIDGDGDLDLVMAVKQGAQFTRGFQILVNNGDRTFSDETLSRISGVTTVGDLVIRVLPIDINADGAPDLLQQHDDVSNLGYPELIFLNNGAGVFTPLVNSVLADKPGLLFPLDADGDGGLDFIVNSSETFDLSLLVQLRPYP